MHGSRPVVDSRTIIEAQQVWSGSVGEEWNAGALGAPEEHGLAVTGGNHPNCSCRLSRVAFSIPATRVGAVERQGQLDRVVTVQVAERDADQRDTSIELILGQGFVEQDAPCL